MAYGISHFFPEGTKEQYEATMIAMNGELGVIPDGQIFHAAGPVRGGWQVVAVHDSKASWDAFLESVFLPRVSAGIDAGFANRPLETEWDVTHFYN
jgi:hypothetical protein